MSPGEHQGRSRLFLRAGGWLVPLFWLLAGCGENPPRLYCGAGLRLPVAEVVEEFSRERGIVVECDYRGSEVLLSTIKLTGEGDLYLPGDAYYVGLAEAAGLVASSHQVCLFVPVILVEKGNPKGIRELSDLSRDDVRLGLGDSKACAIGRTCSEIFRRNGVDEASLEVAVRTATVNELGTYVKLGSVDAAIVWDALAAFYAEEADVVPIPRESNVISTVAVGVLRSSRHPGLASEFVEFITSPRGIEIFQKHHYTTSLPGERRAP